jgi:hypothetical protein
MPRISVIWVILKKDVEKEEFLAGNVINDMVVKGFRTSLPKKIG